MKIVLQAGLLVLLASGFSNEGKADALKVLTAGAFKNVLVGIAPVLRDKSGIELEMQVDTVGGLVKRIEAGETFDIVFASPVALEQLSKSAKIGGKGIDLAKVGVGVGVREGAPMPDISTVEGFKKTLLAAKGVAYIDPAAGGTSGIYVAGLLEKLGIAEQIKSKSILVRGGYSADRIVSGEADIAVQQISEILPVKGVVLAGPLPAEIQSYTIYSAGLAAKTARARDAQALIDLIRSPAGAAIISNKGMSPAALQ
jgi:molybdate transport system substrate-binding protein